MAREGFRTLVVAKKILTEDQYQDFEVCLSLIPYELECRRIVRLQSWTKVLGHFCISGRFPIQTGPTPPLTPQTMLDAFIQGFFRVSTLYRVGTGGREGELQENVEKNALLYEGTQNDRKIRILHYCPKDFCP